MRPIAAMLVCAGVACLPAGAAAQATRWAVEDASVTFVIRNAGLPVDGSFEGVELHVAFDPQAPEAGSLSGTVDPATIRTGIAFRDRHLQGREFFHVARYGPVQLTSVRLGRSADGFEGLFRLRIRDVERDVTIPFAFEGDGSHGMISGELTLDRLDYDVGERSIILSDEVRVTVSARLRRSG